jgi:hypothetical protein
VKIRVETIVYYLERNSRTIIEQKKMVMNPSCPLQPRSAPAAEPPISQPSVG